MAKVPDEFITEAMAGRLLGIDAAQISRNAAAGEYGTTWFGSGRRFISLKALQRKARRTFTFDPADAQDATFRPPPITKAPL